MRELELRFKKYPIKFAIFLFALKEKNVHDFSTKMQTIFEKNGAEILSESYGRRRFSTTRDNYKAEIVAKVKDLKALENDIRTTFSEHCDHVSILPEEEEFEIMTDAEYEKAYLK